MDIDANAARPGMVETSLNRTEVENAAAKRWILVWSLIGGGLLLILLAGSIGQALVPKTYVSATSFGWSPDEAKQIANNVRLVGILAFAAGLVERLAIAISNTRPDAG